MKRLTRGVTPLQLTAGNGNDECVQFLIALGADVNIKAKDRRRPWTFALKNGHEQTAELLRKAMEQR